MFQQIPVNDENIIAYRVSGKLSHKDYQAFLPVLEALLKENPSLSLFIELDDFKGWDLEAAWDDFKFGIDHADDMNRVAIVGHHTWQKWMIHLAQPFMKAKIQYFTHEHLIDAWDWLRKKDEKEMLNELHPYKHILLPVDFTEYSLHIAQRAKEISELYEADLSIIHVVENTVLFTDYYDDYFDTYSLDIVEQQQQLIDISTSKLKQFTTQLNAKTANSEVINGTPVASILSYAEAQEIDLIVMGTHGYKGIDRLLGSTAAGIVHKSRCEVLTVPVI